MDLIQSVDSERLLRAIDKEAARQGLVQNILLEVNIGGEEQKSGVAPDELESLLEQIAPLRGIHVCGLMTVPPILTTEYEKRKIKRNYAN